MAAEESVKYVSIIGSTGYVGAELVRGFAGHPFFRFRHLTSQTFAGKPYSEIYPEFRGIVDVVCEDLPYEEVAKDSDLVITALPHGVSAKIVPELLKAGAKVFTPIVGSTVRLRPVAGLDTFTRILDNIDDIECIEEANERTLQDKFKAVMAEFTPESMARVVKTVLIRKWNRIAAGKKVMAMDEKVLNVAGRKLYEEMAFAMGKDIAYAQKLFEDTVKASLQDTLLIGA